MQLIQLQSKPTKIFRTPSQSRKPLKSGGSGHKVKTEQDKEA
jgi:hypothetical protein